MAQAITGSAERWRSMFIVPRFVAFLSLAAHCSVRQDSSRGMCSAILVRIAHHMLSAHPTTGRGIPNWGLVIVAGRCGKNRIGANLGR